MRVEFEAAAESSQTVAEFDVLLPRETRVEAADREEIFSTQSDITGVQVCPGRRAEAVAKSVVFARQSVGVPMVPDRKPLPRR